MEPAGNHTSVRRSPTVQVTVPIVDCKVEVRKYVRNGVFSKWPNSKGKEELQSPMLYISSEEVQIPVRRDGRGCNKNSVGYISASDLEKESRDGVETPSTLNTRVNAHGVAIVNGYSNLGSNRFRYVRGDRLWIHMDDSTHERSAISSVPVINLRTFQDGNINIDHVCWYPKYRSGRECWTLGGTFQKYKDNKRERYFSWGVCQTLNVPKAFSGWVVVPERHRIPVQEAEKLFFDRLKLLDGLQAKQSFKHNYFGTDRESSNPALPALAPPSSNFQPSITKRDSYSMNSDTASLLGISHRNQNSKMVQQSHFFHHHKRRHSSVEIGHSTRSQEATESIINCSSLSTSNCTPLVEAQIKADKPWCSDAEEQRTYKEVIHSLILEKRTGGGPNYIPAYSVADPRIINNPGVIFEVCREEGRCGIENTEQKSHERCRGFDGSTDTTCQFSYSLDRANPAGVKREHYHLDPQKCTLDEHEDGDHCVTVNPYPAKRTCRYDKPGATHRCCKWTEDDMAKARDKHNGYCEGIEPMALLAKQRNEKLVDLTTDIFMNELTGEILAAHDV